MQVWMTDYHKRNRLQAAPVLASRIDIRIPFAYKYVTF